MFKHLLYLLGASILAILFIHQVVLLLQFVNSGHAFITTQLSQLFTGGRMGEIARASIALLIIPIVVGFIPGGVYWGMKRKEMPFLYHTIWIVWIILLTSIAMHT